MDSERWRRIKDVLAVISKANEDERHILFERECAGDETLRGEIESLLKYERDPDDSIQSLPQEMVVDLLVRLAGGTEQPSDEDLTGRIVGQGLPRYRVIEKIGSGGMGAVYKAEDTKLNRMVALKFLPSVSREIKAGNIVPRGTPYDRSTLERAMREARAASALDHPNICMVHEVDEYKGTPFIIMQYLTGQTVKQAINDNVFSLDRILDLGIQIADALDVAHRHAIVHRDIKSANIFVNDRGEAKILDFGLAKLGTAAPAVQEASRLQEQEPVSVSSDTLSYAGTPMGTAAYMSPEEVLGKDIDARSDIFSYGVVLYEMVTSTLPFRNATLEGTFTSILHDKPTAPSVLNPAIPKELERIIAKTMEKSPDHRYQTAGALRDDLKRLKSKMSSPFRKNKVLLAITTMLFLGVFIGIFSHYKKQPSSSPIEHETVVIGDFSNTTREKIFDPTLKQALRVQLEQSPFLSVASEARAQQELAYMGRPPETMLTGSTAREVCLRMGGGIAVEGSISTLGTRYVIGLQAINCQTGDAVASEQAEADSREKVMQALDSTAIKLRAHLGESMASVQKFNAPIEQATTTSLDALYAYSRGKEVRAKEGEESTISFSKRAIELDPNFAMAYVQLGLAYFQSYQPTLGAAALKQAYELRQRVSEHERLDIESLYYDLVTGQTDKAIQSYRFWKGIYPHDKTPYVNLGVTYIEMGQYGSTLDQVQEASRVGLHSPELNLLLADAYIGLDQLDKAKQVLDKARTQKEDNLDFTGVRYGLAFVSNDHGEMDRLIASAAGQPGIESWLLALQADTQAYQGCLRRSRELNQRAVSLARQDGDEETALFYAASGALREAEVGNSQLAAKQVAAIVAHTQGQQVQTVSALALARAGESEESTLLARDLNQRFPVNTVLNEYWLPIIRGAIELYSQNPIRSVEILERAKPYDLAAPQIPTNVLLYSIYLRGQAYLALGQAAKAEIEFQKILDHRGLIANYLLGSLAYLELGRSYAMEAGVPLVSVSGKPGLMRPDRGALDRTDALAKARSAYEDFFALWKDADPDVPVLKQAKAERARLQ